MRGFKRFWSRNAFGKRADYFATHLLNDEPELRCVLFKEFAQFLSKMRLRRRNTTFPATDVLKTGSQ